jgi:hypothetical protein
MLHPNGKQYSPTPVDSHIRWDCWLRTPSLNPTNRSDLALVTNCPDSKPPNAEIGSRSISRLERAHRNHGCLEICFLQKEYFRALRHPCGEPAFQSCDGVNGRLASLPHISRSRGGERDAVPPPNAIERPASERAVSEMLSLNAGQPRARIVAWGHDGPHAKAFLSRHWVRDVRLRDFLTAIRKVMREMMAAGQR